MRFKEMLREYRMQNQEDLDTFLNQFRERVKDKPKASKFFSMNIRSWLKNDENYVSTPSLPKKATKIDKDEIANNKLKSFQPTKNLRQKLELITKWLEDLDSDDPMLDNLNSLTSIDEAYEKAKNHFKE